MLFRSPLRYVPLQVTGLLDRRAPARILGLDRPTTTRGGSNDDCRTENADDRGPADGADVDSLHPQPDHGARTGQCRGALKVVAPFRSTIEFVSSGNIKPFKIYLYEDQMGNLFGTAHPEYRGATNIVVFTHDISTMLDH